MLGILSASTSAARGEKQQPSVSDQSGQNVHIINVLDDHHIRYIKDNGRKNKARACLGPCAHACGGQSSTDRVDLFNDRNS